MLLARIVQRLSDSLLSGADANDGVFHAVWPANPRQGLVVTETALGEQSCIKSSPKSLNDIINLQGVLTCMLAILWMLLQGFWKSWGSRHRQPPLTFPADCPSLANGQVHSCDFEFGVQEDLPK